MRLAIVSVASRALRLDPLQSMLSETSHTDETGDPRHDLPKWSDLDVVGFQAVFVLVL